MQRKIGIWLWAIPVLVSGLRLLPLWLVFFAGDAIESGLMRNPSRPGRRSGGRAKPTPGPSRWAEELVDLVARCKSVILAFAIAVAFLLFVVCMVFVFGEHEGHQLTERAADIGGYVAIVGLVLGLPALGYAMVTDRAVEKIQDSLGTTDRRLKQIRQRIKERVEDWKGEIPKEHQVQIFVPNRQLTRIVPIYDPDQVGPVAGWESNERAPQAITGSAFASEAYLHGENDELRQQKLRLTAEQLESFEHLTGVAAAPIRYDDRVIGVLTVFTAAEKPQTGEETFISDHEELAEWLAPVVKDYVPERGPLTPKDLEAPSAPPVH